MDPRSEVLLRQPDCLAGRTLLAGLPADELLVHSPEAWGWSWHAGHHAYLDRRFAGRVYFGTTPPAGDYDNAVLFLPKSKELADYLLMALASRLAHGTLYLVGEKRGGIERAAKQLQAFGTPVKLDSARHCQLWRVSQPKSESRPLETLSQTFTLFPDKVALDVVSLPGVFSHGRLDKGTALLLEHLDHLPTGPLLDFGCGAGIVGATLKQRYSENPVYLLDVDAFAVQSSQMTLAANQLEGTLIVGDGIAAAPRDLAAIISNPPFHQGVHTHYQASETLLQEAVHHLKPGGELRLVANSFLKYPPLIEQYLGPCETLAERDGFKVYRARRRS
ncbi:16S rRNA (guanine1207-N2)-methyltransferase [Pseudomonas duriflava]|uniref:Ribosomal RNA small subunit methyltransferase C n=1 Tax=Pseudomonas duriflava TaxID=459528 RepID=A0A562QDR5_9PSED|nr:class I SAM-dependent methyltransferase [Pseudomonas duriflava]TWI54891.1 16S rRNA (guanine1207-N2)-methyltransferase [Pseudomonas duriflava]